MTVFTPLNDRRTKPTKNTMPDLNEFMTTQEAAEKLGFTLQGVSKLIRQNRLSAVRFGKVYFVLKESVKTYQETTKGKSKNNPHRGKKAE